MELHDLTFGRLREAIATGALKAADVAESVLDRADSVEDSVGAFLTRATREDVLSRADDIDRAIRRGDDPGPLAGIPIAVKDNISTRGVRTTCGSRMLDGYVPPYDATAVARMVRAGAVLVGKTNLDEFAMGSSTEHSALGATRNPWDRGRVPGGSSGGSAAAVAAGEAALALGSDTGGSIRQPAGFCGVVGLKPTYGRVSRYGLVAFASSLDQIGPMSGDVTGAAAALSVMSGRDAHDASSSYEDVGDYEAAVAEGVEGMTIGLPDEYFAEGLDPEVEASVTGAAEALTRLGARLKRVSMPGVRYGIACYYVLANAEASSNLARFDGVAYGLRDRDAADLGEMYRSTRGRGFGPEVRRRIALGTYSLSAGYHDQYYGRAQRVRKTITGEFERVLSDVDVLVAPTSPTTAFAVGERLSDPLAMYLSDVYTVPASLAGVAAVSLPCGLDSGGLPIGVQLMAGAFREAELFRAAGAHERARGGPGPAAPLGGKLP